MTKVDEPGKTDDMPSLKALNASLDQPPSNYLALDLLVQNFNLIFDTSKDVFNLFSLSQRKILAQNIRAAEASGLSSEQLQSVQVELLYPPEEVPKLFASLERLVRDGSSQEKLRMYHANGSLRDLWIRSFIIQREPELISLVHTIDITEEKQKAEAAMEASKMTLLGEVSAVLAHELKNSIQALQSSIFLMEGDENSYFSPFAKERFERSKQALSHMESVVRNIGQYIKASPSETRPLSLGSALMDALHLLDSYLDQKKIHISLDLPSELPPVKVDPGQLQQMLLNLIKNAVQSMLVKDRRDLSFSAALLKDGERAGRVRLSIKDSGAGIPEEMRGKIFEAFASSKPSGIGTGLGLSVTRRLAAANDINIDFETTAGEGATFHLYFPAGASLGVPAGHLEGLGVLGEATPAKCPAGARGHRVILLISDSEETDKLAEALGGLPGHQAIIARSPGEGLSILSVQKIDLVVCNADSYPVSGLQVASEVKKQHAVPVVILALKETPASASETASETNTKAILSGAGLSPGELARQISSRLD